MRTHTADHPATHPNTRRAEPSSPWATDRHAARNDRPTRADQTNNPHPRVHDMTTTTTLRVPETLEGVQ